MKHKKPTILQQEAAEQEPFFSRQEEKEHFFNKPQHGEGYAVDASGNTAGNTGALNIQKKCAGCAAEEKEQETIQKKEAPGSQPATPAATTPPAPPGAPATQQPAAQAAAQQAGGQFIVADNMVPNAGQMRKSAFLVRLREEVCATVNSAMTGTPYTSANCPYIQFAFARYQNSSPQQLEALLHRYAPLTLFAHSAEDLVRYVKLKVYTVALQWARRRMQQQNNGAANGEQPQQNDAGFGNMFFKENAGGASRTQSPGAVMNSLGKGSPLPGSTRKTMEQAFGSSFSGVEVHTDNHAAQLSKEMNARAFTVGNHIAFAGGEFKPGTLTGDALLAHELAHTIQQSGTEKDSSAAYQSMEEEADNSAVSAVLSAYGLKKELKELDKEKLPKMKTGLKLQRCVAAAPAAGAAGAELGLGSILTTILGSAGLAGILTLESDTPREAERVRSCSTDFPAAINCFSLPADYMYNSESAAFNTIRARHPGARKEKRRASTSGPCPGVGEHIAVKDGGEYLASIVSCPCCQEGPGGPVLTRRYAVLWH